MRVLILNLYCLFYAFGLLSTIMIPTVAQLIDSCAQFVRRCYRVTSPTLGKVVDVCDLSELTL